MTRDDLLDLVEFNAWARDRMLGAVGVLTPDQYVRPLGNSFSSVRDTAVHIYSAEWVWYMRCQGQSPTAPLSPEDFPDLPTLTAAWHIIERQWRAFLEALGEDEHTREIDYRQMNGQAYTSPIWHIVQHVVNHSSYHRGQVMTLLRQLGVPAIGTDLITFRRERRIRR